MGTLPIGIGYWFFFKIFGDDPSCFRHLVHIQYMNTRIKHGNRNFRDIGPRPVFQEGRDTRILQDLIDQPDGGAVMMAEHFLHILSR